MFAPWLTSAVVVIKKLDDLVNVGVLEVRVGRLQEGGLCAWAGGVVVAGEVGA